MFSAKSAHGLAATGASIRGAVGDNAWQEMGVTGLWGSSVGSDRLERAVNTHLQPKAPGPPSSQRAEEARTSQTTPRSPRRLRPCSALRRGPFPARPAERGAAPHGRAASRGLPSRGGGCRAPGRDGTGQSPKLTWAPGAPPARPRVKPPPQTTATRTVAPRSPPRTHREGG